MATACVLGHAAAGHIQPTLPVVQELVRRGDRVIYYATEPFRARIERHGAWFVSYGPQSLFERNLGRGGLLGGMAGLMETAEEILPTLIESLKSVKPDYLLIEAHAVWGTLAQQVLGTPAAAMNSMFAISDALLSPADLIGLLYGTAPQSVTLEGLLGLTSYFDTALRIDGQYGTRSPGILDYLGNPQPLNLVLTSRAFQVASERFGPTYEFVGATDEDAEERGIAATKLAQINPRHSERGRVGGRERRISSYVKHGLGGVLRSLRSFAHTHPTTSLRMTGNNPRVGTVRSRDPLIYVSMGTMYNDEPALYDAVVDAFADRRCRVIMSVGERIDAAHVPRGAANIVIRPSVPQRDVLREADLFITHGGINSAHEAMLRGVPMIVLPRTADHHIVAGQVEAGGAGVVIERALATAESLRTTAAHVLARPAYRLASAALGDTLREAGGAVRAADCIDAFKRRHGL